MRKSEKEALQAMLDDEQETIKALEKAYQRAIRRIDNHIRILESDEMTQSKIYQKRYQEAMKAQINAALDELHKKSNQTIEEYLTRSYQHGYVGTMYSLHKQGMPILAPIDQRAVTRAVRTDSKLSGRLYGELGVDMQKLKKTIRREISIGISIGSDYNMIARQVQISSGIPLKRAKTIVRTEGHRIQQQSADDARNAAKGQGCQVVKQWDAVLDGNTRTDHRILDGQIREVGEPFEIDGKKAEYPGAFGRPEEDCNCRCVALTRAKWALDADELQTMKDRAKFFGLDKTEGFREFEEKYLRTTEVLKKQQESVIIITDKQLGHKAGKHMQEWGLNPSKPDDRIKFVEITQKIQRDPQEIRRVQWQNDPQTGKRTVEVNAFILGRDVVLVADDGEYITTMKDGIENQRVQNGRRINDGRRPAFLSLHPAMGERKEVPFCRTRV